NDASLSCEAELWEGIRRRCGRGAAYPLRPAAAALELFNRLGSAGELIQDIGASGGLHSESSEPAVELARQYLIHRRPIPVRQIAQHVRKRELGTTPSALRS
ncbi:MAG TPA: hypothetical protein VF883_11515, partial [Thermoanaerobaculia bacterium]